MYRFARAENATLCHGQTFAIFFLFIVDSAICHVRTISLNFIKNSTKIIEETYI